MSFLERYERQQAGEHVHEQFNDANQWEIDGHSVVHVVAFFAHHVFKRSPYCDLFAVVLDNQIIDLNNNNNKIV